ncbi:uncharacterized protein VP01_326g4 [Puccinia sorghi]|uniref:Uncharacterized protein n=1 Tax=Puccinia sorghi TaxID=27349 RepID=A0A0L6UXT3_9BASI|nr:uncharacterized protein VP01_326g4 [Puccinia sorghi]
MGITKWSQAICKKKPLKEFLQLFNVNAMSLMNTTSRSGLATHTMWLFLQSQETIKNKYILKQSKISFTQDVWMSPNCVAFMAVTAHLIDKNFVMRDLTLAVPQVQDSIDCLHIITTNNTSINSKMVAALILEIPHFKWATHLLECVAHVIHLAAQVGIGALGLIEDTNTKKQLLTMMVELPTLSATPNPMHISFVTSPANINAKTILKRVHGLCTYICLTLPSTKTKMRPYILSSAKWDQGRHILNLLEPLLEATELLCTSKYPTINLVVYIVLIQHLQITQQGLYNQEQLIIQAHEMINKVDHYLKDAIHKPIYITAMILDPTFKITFWKNHKEFIQEYYGLTLSNVLYVFCHTAEDFAKDQSAESNQNTPLSAENIKKKLFFNQDSTLPAQRLEPKRKKPLAYWAACQNQFSLYGGVHFLGDSSDKCLIQTCILQGPHIVSWQQLFLKPKSIEHLLFLRDWFQTFDGCKYSRDITEHGKWLKNERYTWDLMKKTKDIH